MFQQMLLGEVAYTMLPGIMYEDNEGAIYLSKNKQVSQRTKHIDLRYHFLRDFVDKKNESCGHGMMMKVDTKENFADLMTKNVDGATLEYLGDDLDKGLERFRGNVYEELTQQLGGMSRVLEYEVAEPIYPVDNWIKHIKKKGEKSNEGEKAFSKQVKKEEEVSLVEKFTENVNCEVSCNIHRYVGHTRFCTVRDAGVRRNTQDTVQEFLCAVTGKGRTDRTKE